MTTRIVTALCLATALLAAGATPAAEVPEGIGDGIKVHGHWKIEIYDPDGTLVSSYEFENHFSRPIQLSEVLRRQSTPGLWSVVLHRWVTSGTRPCTVGTATAGCLLSEPASPYTAENLFKTLIVSGEHTVVLAGTATAGADSEIDTVWTVLDTCDSATSPASCTASMDPTVGVAPFAQTTLPTPQPVLPGQIIQVTVTISFS